MLIAALKDGFSGLTKFNLSRLSLKNALLAILILGLTVFAYLGWTRGQNLVAEKPENVTITFIAPKAGLSVLGNTAIRAKLTSTTPLVLNARLNVDGVFEKVLTVERISDNLVNISGTWESGKVPPGEHNLEIDVYNEKTNPPTLVGKASIAVNSVSP